ncbi:MAG TPA: pentapeptide repeat-containing protein [Alphaproteobacteria bacterium]|nr:pentapeptide repeat-containing protein [Alphaproteobacteria bacterium]HOO49994.1 pentapeptide repeat-containing protein [Alphaproteobacteria bacterium]
MKKHITLRNQAHEPLYSGEHTSTAEALEHCITHNIPLDGLFLSNENLKNANLDGLNLRNASLINCNLKGANISEASLFYCNLSYSNLEDACLCYSDFHYCRFEHVNFKKTDIAQAIFQNPVFSGSLTNQLNFATAHKLESPAYISDNSRTNQAHHKIAFKDHYKLTKFLMKTVLRKIITPRKSSKMAEN